MKPQSEPEEPGFTQRKRAPCSASPTRMQLMELGQSRASRPGTGQLGNALGFATRLLSLLAQCMGTYSPLQRSRASAQLW